MHIKNKERRPLRVKLRDIQRKIKRAEDTDSIEDPTSGAFEQFRNKITNYLKKHGIVVRVC